MTPGRPTDLTDPVEPPVTWTWRLSVGVVLMVLQMLLGWPAVALIGSSAAWTANAELALYGAPGVYGLSWVLLGAAVVIGGPDAARVTRRASRRALARLSRRWPS